MNTKQTSLLLDVFFRSARNMKLNASEDIRKCYEIGQRRSKVVLIKPTGPKEHIFYNLMASE